MAPHRIGVIPGDGIGPEVVAEATKVLEAAGVAFHAVEYDLGANRYLRTGEALPDAVVEELRALDALLLGAVGHPDVPPGVLERGLLLRLRTELDLYVNLRPVRLLPGAPTPLAGKTCDDVDLVVVRENTEGAYVGGGGVLRQGTAAEVATQSSVNTRFGVERCVRFAFDLAARRARHHLTLCHKANVLTYAGGLWRRTVDEVAAGFPGVEVDYVHVDAACLHLVEQPERFDVLVTDNLFGDILTDLGAAIAGGMGLAASGNLNPERTTPSMFEPVHGSAPDLAGSGRANPLAMILSTAMMLDHLGEVAAAARIEQAVAAVLEKQGLEKQGGAEAASVEHSTAEIGDLVAEQVAHLAA